MARSVHQMVEVIHLVDGEDSPRRVLCRWRAGAHPLSLLPAAPYLAGRCSSDGRPLRAMWLAVRSWRMCSVFVHWQRRWSAS